MPLKSLGFRGFLLLSKQFRKKTLDFSDLKNIARPHPFLSLLDEGMRSYFGKKTQDEWTLWTGSGGGVSGLYFG